MNEQVSPKRMVVLDTETTGLEPADGHRVIEIGCVELVERRLTHRNFHRYLQPDREVDAGAVEVHGISNEFLADKPRFGDVVEDFLAYCDGAELIIHNAPFDVGFLNHELRLWRGEAAPAIDAICTITDTLVMARRMHPGQRNSLDALCKRYGIDNTRRDLHGALLDAEILADVYLAMTGGQVSLHLGGESDRQERGGARRAEVRRISGQRPPLRVLRASEQELAAHGERLRAIEAASGGACVWLANNRE
ncbi:MAG: DNA polymerase III subunit epsilon [Thiohalocapsa sp.]